MGDHEQESSASSQDDIYEPVIGDLGEEDYPELHSGGSGKQRLLAKRRRAERRLEELRLREELGDDDFELDFD